MDTVKVKKILLTSVPIAVPFYLADKAAQLWRYIPNGEDTIEKGTYFAKVFGDFLSSDPLPSFNIQDLFIAALVSAGFNGYLYYRKKNAKKFRKGREYGSARWGNEKDIKPYMDNENFENNIILTQTERLTMGKPSHPKYARNKNVLVIGGSGSGKTRFFVKPNIMQLHSSYVVTDPKGTVLLEVGNLLKQNGYKIKFFNTVDFSKSMHYNPFCYIKPETREQDILKFVEVLIKNTSGSGEQNKGEDFWVKAERLLYTAYIAMMFCVLAPEERTFRSLIEMINLSVVKEEDENYKNTIDWEFEAVEKWINNNVNEETDTTIMKMFGSLLKQKPTEEQISIGRFACKQYRSYKLAAGKTAKSILISCSARLASFSIDKILEITSKDEMGLDKIGDEPTALFIVISDTDATFNFLVSMLYTQMFNLLCTKADNNPDGSGKLKYHVRCILDEFANIGLIPNFEKLIATIRSREISACIILQALSQLKAIYKDNADTIVGNCDTTLFLGGKEKTTLKEMSEILGKETIDDSDMSESRGQSSSTSTNFKKLGKELMSQDELAVMDGGKCILQLRGVRPFLSNKFDIEKHKQYSRLSDYDPKNRFDIAKHLGNVSKRRLTLGKKDTVSVYRYQG